MTTTNKTNDLRHLSSNLLTVAHIREESWYACVSHYFPWRPRVCQKKGLRHFFSIGIHSSNSWKLNFVHMYIASPTVIKRPQALRGFPLVAVGGACKGNAVLSGYILQQLCWIIEQMPHIFGSLGNWYVWTLQACAGLLKFPTIIIPKDNQQRDVLYSGLRFAFVLYCVEDWNPYQLSCSW